MKTGLPNLCTAMEDDSCHLQGLLSISLSAVLGKHFKQLKRVQKLLIVQIGIEVPIRGWKFNKNTYI